MPSTENATLQRIQREISEVMERENELRNGYVNSVNNNNENESKTSLQELKEEKPNKPSSTMTNGNKPPNGLRLFTQNANVKGVMYKFIKSRGKLSPSKVLNATNDNNNKPSSTWTIPDFLEPPRVTEHTKCIRKGYVPVQERMRKEFDDLHVREMELRSERRKSQPDFRALIDLESPPPPAGNLRGAKSMAQLYNADDFYESSSAPASLKPALSLAELCDASEEEVEIPGSHSLILQWEQMIQKNQQART